MPFPVTRHMTSMASLMTTKAVGQSRSLATVNGWISLPVRFTPGAVMTGCDPVIPVFKDVVAFDAITDAERVSMAAIMGGA